VDCCLIRSCIGPHLDLHLPARAVGLERGETALQSTPR
jgi:hypothetical protein